MRRTALLEVRVSALELCLSVIEARVSVIASMAWIVLTTLIASAASTHAQGVQEARLDASGRSSPVLRPLWSLDTGG